MPRPLLTAGALLLASATAMAAPRVGTDSRLPVPRYESIATAEAWGRRGPGKDHRIEWVYRTRGLPVRVIEESGPWRRVKDPAGDEVWIHASRLSPNRTVFVAGEADPGIALRDAPRAEGHVVAWLKKGVVGALTECVGGWRKLTVDGETGWVAAEGLWAGEDCTLPR
jgi:SH3-like domain-containing protein